MGGASTIYWASPDSADGRHTANLHRQRRREGDREAPVDIHLGAAHSVRHESDVDPRVRREGERRSRILHVVRLTNGDRIAAIDEQEIIARAAIPPKVEQVAASVRVVCAQVQPERERECRRRRAEVHDTVVVHAIEADRAAAVLVRARVEGRPRHRHRRAARRADDGGGVGGATGASAHVPVPWHLPLVFTY